MLRPCPNAPVPMAIYVLAPTTCPTYYHGSPLPELWCGVDQVLGLGWQGGGAGVQRTH
jgi:hypothetical protein